MTVEQSPRRVVIVVRHGERLDYVMRDRGENWVPSSERPWDPPLTAHGHEQAQALGQHFPQLLQENNLPPIAAVYSSPFWRCRQTAAGIAKSLQHKVRVELGLVESLNQNWFRSWAVSGTDGTWGFGKGIDLDPESLHPRSKEPVQPLLDWKEGETDDTTLLLMDASHVSKTTIDTPYCLHPHNFESTKMQRKRMAETIVALSEDHINETIVLVSHGT